MNPLVRIPEPLLFPIKLVAALIGLIVVSIGIYIGATVQVYVLGWALDLFYWVWNLIF